MPISVLCPGCKARFNVSDQYAGKKGPCPKCKTVITIPAAAPEVKEEIKIHVPEEYAAGGKDVKGRAITKPIARQEVKVKPVQVAGIAGAAIVMFAIALSGRFMAKEKRPPLFALLAVVVAAPLAVAGYSFLRDDELEPYRGRPLLIRASICAVVYAALWGVYALLRNYGLLTGDVWEWLYALPVFIVLGASAAWACFDLDFGSASLHYTFYVLMTLALLWAMNLQDTVWTSAAPSTLRNPTRF